MLVFVKGSTDNTRFFLFIMYYVLMRHYKSSKQLCFLFSFSPSLQQFSCSKLLQHDQCNSGNNSNAIIVMCRSKPTSPDILFPSACDVFPSACDVFPSACVVCCQGSSSDKTAPTPTALTTPTAHSINDMVDIPISYRY